MRIKHHSAFSLIEMIITLSVIAVLLGALVISFIKRLDRIAGEKEVAALKSIGTAFKESVRRTRYVPDETGWASAVATQLGWEQGDITANDRNASRIFLIDPGMQIGANSGVPLLPYSQSISGSIVTNALNAVVRPFNPRFMIVSSIGHPLPSSLVSGLGATTGANAFTNIWSTADGAVPNGWTWGSGRDLKIQRVDLSDLFIPIVLANADPSRLPFYGVDNLTPVGVYTNPPPREKFFIKGSELKLYNASNVLEYAEIIYTAHDFTFELGSWQGKPFLGRAVGNPNGKDLQRAMDLFLRSPPNPNGDATQVDVYNAMISYMTNFIAWRDAGYPGESCPGPVANNTLTDAVADARNNLSNQTGDLINP